MSFYQFTSKRLFGDVTGYTAVVLIYRSLGPVSFIYRVTIEVYINLKLTQAFTTKPNSCVKPNVSYNLFTGFNLVSGRSSGLRQPQSC